MKKKGDFSKDNLAKLGLGDLDELEFSQERQAFRSVEFDISQNDPYDPKTAIAI
jgi:hypothetical protein